MKIVCLSDTHCQLSDIQVPGGDVLVHAGDLTYRGDPSEVMGELVALRDLPHRHKIVVAGNHDWLFQKDNATARRYCNSLGLIYLEDSGVTIDGVKFWGSPWQPEFWNWAFNLSRYDGSLAERWRHIPEDTDVLITHGPPSGVGDLTKGYDGQGPVHAGCYDLMERVKQLKLKAHVFGHIHPGYGVYRNYHGLTNTVFVNASNCNNKYDPVNAPVVIELEAGVVTRAL